MNYTAYKTTKLTGGLLFQKQQLNRKITIDAVYNRFFDTGRIDAFKCIPGKEVHFFWDSDVAKWIEGASYIIAKGKNNDLEAKIENIIDDIEKNQSDDGYFNIYFTVVKPNERFTNRDFHELYCAGHLIEAAIAYYEATGKDRFLKIMIKYAEHIEKVFKIDNSASFVTPGHEEIELALFRLYKLTGQRRWFELMLYFIEQRGNNEKDGHTPAFQDFPVRSQKKATGHSVRLMYLYIAVSEAAKELGDEELIQRCKDIFEDIVNYRMYITGGLGTNYFYEGFTSKYDLPNRGAYTETCAAISFAYFCRNMLDIEKDSRYADVLETLLYNGALSGLSLDGKGFFYENPLEINLRHNRRLFDSPSVERNPPEVRKEVFDCSCCPPNINRFLEELEGFLYDVQDTCAYVHIFADSVYDDGKVNIKTTANYPANGKVVIETKGVKTLYVRIPAWCKKTEFSAEYTLENGYAKIENVPEKLTVNFEMTSKLIQANILVSNNIGRACVMYGPVVYCIEGVDNGENLHALYLDKNFEAQAIPCEECGMNILTTNGFERVSDAKSLYSEYSEEYKPKSIKLIPYYIFANRGSSDMLVYVKVK